MTDPTLPRVSEIFHVAAALPTGDRAAYLAEACGDDAALRREVDWLLAHEHDSHFLDVPAVELVATSSAGSAGGTTPLTGRQLGVYQVAELIGAGGMGEVYRARDTALGRDVAIKILPGAVAHDRDRLARFEREAHALAALNHPHIAQIYGTIETGNGPGLVMELVPGRTLAEHLTDERRLPLQEVLRIASQIADALDAAHTRGIVHRDLKPANVKITPGRAVKVLDFGLARMDGAAGGLASTAETPPETRQGLVLGTAAYMSPEQARGLPVDKRTDIWAFGCLTYEMLTGRSPFDAPTLMDTLASVLNRDADWDALPPGTPARLRELLRRCLCKDPARRLRDIGDARLELLEIEEELQKSEPAPATQAAYGRSTPRRWPMVAGGTGVAASLATALASTYWRAPSPAPPRVQFVMDPPAGTRFNNLAAGLAISPDGRFVVFSAVPSEASVGLLWLRPLDSEAPRALAGTQGGQFPTWSPNARSLAFFADGQLKRVDIGGGAPLSLCEAGVSDGLPGGASWSRDDVIVFSSSAGLKRVPASGGAPAPLTRVDASRGETAHGFPQFLSDGDRFLYFVASDDSNVQGVYAGSISGTHHKTLLLRTPSKAEYVPAHDGQHGSLLWMQDRTLVAQSFDEDTLQLQGDPSPIAEDVNVNIYDSRPAFSAARAWALVYFAGPPPTKRRLVWMRRGDETPVTAAPDEMYWNVALAPDGQRLAVSRWSTDATAGPPNLDLWLWEFARGRGERVTFSPARDGAPVWSFDGSDLIYASARDRGVAQLYRRPASGGDVREELLTEGSQYKIATGWSRDGKYVLFGQQGDVMALPLGGSRTPMPVARTPFNEAVGTFSPDGHWVAFAANYTGRFEVYVQPFPGDDGAQRRTRISIDGGFSTQWSHDGKELFFQGLNGVLMSAGIRIERSGVRADKPRPVFNSTISTPTRARQFDVTSDGRFLMILSSPEDRQPVRLTVVSNWQSAIR